MKAQKQTQSIAFPQKLPLQSGVRGTAIFSKNKLRRYKLTRSWNLNYKGGTAFFCGMNPSYASATHDDKTVRKWQMYARLWGYDKILVGNIHSYISTDQNQLLFVKNPIGNLNFKHLWQMASEANLIVLSYGSPGSPELRANGRNFALALSKVYPVWVFGLSKNQAPLHPLYLPNNLEPLRWHP